MCYSAQIPHFLFPFVHSSSLHPPSLVTYFFYLLLLTFLLLLDLTWYQSALSDLTWYQSARSQSWLVGL